MLDRIAYNSTELSSSGDGAAAHQLYYPSFKFQRLPYSRVSNSNTEIQKILIKDISNFNTCYNCPAHILLPSKGEGTFMREF